MQISCSHCSQLLEIDQIWLGQAIVCPLCENAFTIEVPTDEFLPENPETSPTPIPEASSHAAPLPAVHRTLPKDLPNFMPATMTPRRPAPPMPPPPQNKKSGAPIILLLMLLFTGGFVYGMIHYQESPQGFFSHIKRVPSMLLQLPPEQIFKKLGNFFALNSTPQLSPTPAPTPGSIQEATPAAAGAAGPTPISQGNPSTPSDTDSTPQSSPAQTNIITPFGTRQ